MPDSTHDQLAGTTACGTVRGRTIWIDVEDLFDYVRANPRPSGIQRLAFLLQTELHALARPGADVRFVRHAADDRGFTEIAWTRIEALFAGLTDAAPGAEDATAGADRRPLDGLRRVAHPLIARLPRSVREPLIYTVHHQRLSLLAFGRLFRACIAALANGLRRPRDAAAPFPATRAEAAPAAAIGPGDWLLVLGSPWFEMDYGGLLRESVLARGGRVGVLVYDLIPVRRPEWVPGNLTHHFARWLAAIVPLSDTVFTISRATTAELRAYAAEVGLALPGRITVIPIGSAMQAPSASAAARARPTGDYVLFVSTLEVRKNHTLLFRVWRRLLEELPADDVPTLVFVGKIGWLVADLMQQMRTTEFLGGKIVLMDNASDAELADLYRGCLFTVFPSMYEGWGLPVTESLAFGKPCIVADNSSLPEAGGDLARYIDAGDTGGAYEVIRATLADRAGLAAWQARVETEFRPVPWRAGAETIFRELVPELATNLEHELAPGAAAAGPV